MWTVLGGASTGAVAGAGEVGAGDSAGAAVASLGAVISNASRQGESAQQLAHKPAHEGRKTSEARQRKCLSGFDIGTAGFEPATP